MTVRIDPADRWEIQDLLMQYVLANDTGDIESYVGSFAPDAVLVSSDDEWREGHPAIREHGRHMMGNPRQRGRQHHFQPVRMVRNGEAVEIFSYWMVVFRASENEPPVVRSMGSAEDICRKIDGEWKIAKRIIRRWDAGQAPWHLGAQR